MTRYTDQFETVLPEDLRMKMDFRATPPPATLKSSSDAKRILFLLKFILGSLAVYFIGLPILGCLITAIVLFVYFITPHTSHTPYRPSPVVENLLANPTPWATPAPATEAPAASAPSSVAETRSQEPQWFEKWRYTEADMPYGEKVMSKYLGDLPNQEALPRGPDNRVGDTYKIGKDYFTWVTPGGVGQWIDPVKP